MVRREAVVPDDRQQSNPILDFRTNMAGIGWFLWESGRNSIHHGSAKQVTVNLGKVRLSDAEPVLEVIDDGVGMDADGRWRFIRWGYSLTGNGTGVRETAMTIAQTLEVHTVTADEPTVAWRIKLPLVQFLVDVKANQWKGEWEKVPRSESRLPPSFSHGTMIVLSDFRAPDIHALRRVRRITAREILEHLRPTLSQITEENIRSRIPTGFPPDEARLFVVNGRRIQPKAIEGFLLWKEAVHEKPGLGSVSGEVRFAEGTSGNWLMIGGSTATIPLATFLNDMREPNPELAKRVRAILREKRLTGHIRLGVLDDFPTKDREHMLADFYTSASAQVAVDELDRIAGKMEERMREYDAQPHSQLTEGLIAEFVARMHDAQGIKPQTEQSGVKRGPGTPTTTTSGGEDVVTGPLPRLIVEPAQLKLEPWDGGDARDSATAIVTNPLPGEEFDWQDIEGLGLLRTAVGNLNTVQAPRQQGIHLVVVRSRLHPTREATVQVEVRQSEDAPTAPDIFSVIPSSTTVHTGQERYVRIRSEGGTSGKYEWKVEPEMRKGERACRLIEQPGGREVKFVAYIEGRYMITCVDRENPGRRTLCKVEVLARASAVPPTSCPPGTVSGGVGDGTVVTSGGVGTGSDAGDTRTGVVTGHVLHYRHGDTDWTFTLHADASISEPFYVEPENRRIFIGDLVLGRFDDPEAQRRHIASCTSDGIACVLLHEGALPAEDHVAYAQLVGDILDKVMPKKTGNGNKK